MTNLFLIDGHNFSGMIKLKVPKCIYLYTRLILLPIFGGSFLSGFAIFDCPSWKLFPMEYTTLHIDLGTNSMLWIAGNWQILQGKKIIYHVIAQWQISASGQIR